MTGWSAFYRWNGTEIRESFDEVSGALDFLNQAYITEPLRVTGPGGELLEGEALLAAMAARKQEVEVGPS